MFQTNCQLAYTKILLSDLILHLILLVCHKLVKSLFMYCFKWCVLIQTADLETLLEVDFQWVQ